MELLQNLLYGFDVVLTGEALLYCLIGVTIGTLVGVLPGLGPVAAISVLLPITYFLPPIPALIMLTGIYYGTAYGGAITSILINIPGEAYHVVTCLDGHEMARQGLAGPALGMSAIASFLGGTISMFVIVLFAPPLAEIALDFGSVEYFSLMLLGLVSAVILAHDSVLKATAMVFVGLQLGMVGVDVSTGMARFTFGDPNLVDGISFIVVALGVFGFAEITASAGDSDVRSPYKTAIRGLFPSLEDWKRSWAPILRGTALGSIFGVLPGTGATITSFASYTMEKRLSSTPWRFGKGAIEGVAGPESANNAAAQTSIIPLLTLGIPASATMAVMLGAMMIVGIEPGPQVMVKNPDLFWGLIVSMWIGNLFLIILNLPLIGLWVRLLRIPYRLLYPAVLLVACMGIYSVHNNPFDIVIGAGFGLFGFLLRRLGCEPAPMLLAFILGPLMEEHLRRAMLLSRGDPSVFFTHPISAAFLAVAALMTVLIITPRLRRVRRETPQTEG